MKLFRKNNGEDIYKEFPLKYRDRLFNSALEELYEPIPGKDDLDEVHEWNLKQYKGINMLFRYLWKDASEEDKKKTKSHIADYIKVFFENYYVEEEGAFSYYPHAKHASIDGSSVLIFSDLGAFSHEKQTKLWGEHEKNISNKGVLKLKEIKKAHFDSIAKDPNINSIRIYASQPDFYNLTDSVWAVVYPNTTPVLDIMELVPNIVHWTKSSSLSIGNWGSMVELKNEYAALNIKKPLIFKDRLPFEEINKKFEAYTTLYVIGFDALQIPCLKIEYRNE